MGALGSLWPLTPYNDAGGLIDPSQAMAAQRQGMLGLGAGLLGSAGPNRLPVSFGQALSSGLIQSNAMQNNAIDDQMKRQLLAGELLQRMMPRPSADSQEIIPVNTPQGVRYITKAQAAQMGGQATPYVAPPPPMNDYQKQELDLRRQELAQKSQAATDFSGPVGDLMAALAEKGYALPAGMRSKEQQAATFQGIIRRHPDETPDDIASGIISGKIGLMTETQAAKEYTSSRQGTAGGTLNSINTSIKHIASAMPLVDAMQTGDVTAFNRAKNYFEQNVGGSTAPTDFNALKEFIQGEVARAVIPGGGGEQERQALGASVAAANNPQAIKSAMQKFQTALAGKTDALRLQWDEATQGKQGPFDRFLLPETKAALQAAETQSASAPQAAIPNRNARGWILHEDAKGNRAYVSPDGKQYEAVQ